MEEESHQKHTKLIRRNVDNFASNEIAVLGTNCSNIANFVKKTSKIVSKRAKIAYLDASHSDNVAVQNYAVYVAHKSGNFDINSTNFLNPYNERIRFSNYDLLFINGNHYNGSKQILILDNEKEASVKKRLDQLTSVQFVVKLNEESRYFDFLVEQYPTIKNLKCYHIDDLEGITKHLENLIEEKTAPVQGLVLAGGKSSRMGKDKTRINYHGKEQLEYTVDLLESNLIPTYVSVALDQDYKKHQIIRDTFVNLGAFGAICSAFQSDPNKAWLVLATDLPFLDETLIKKLLKFRNPSKDATAIKGMTKQFVEPLITIYEPKSYPILLNFLSQGYACPRKALINSDVEIVEVDDAFIRNVNTPEEYQDALNSIQGVD